MHITLPEVLAINENRAKNPVRQRGEPSAVVEGTLDPFTDGRLHGSILRGDGARPPVLIVAKTRHSLDGHSYVVEARLDQGGPERDFSKRAWLRHPLLNSSTASRDRGELLAATTESWRGAFSYSAEIPSRNVVGLRAPQLGALHAVQAHWFASEAPATVVMPTGTGKTDTMISILVATPCQKLLVVVPTDALRYQLAQKFLTLGILKAQGSAILSRSAEYPVVCTMRHIPRNPDEVDEVFRNAQVIVTTSAVAGSCNGDVQSRMAELCPFLFIDEAHHAEAPTWRSFKERFRDRRVVQFTATPFREDGQLLDGKIVFNYPLQRAQTRGLL